MKKLNTVAFTAKGALKPAVRSAILDATLPEVADALAELGFEYVADRKAYALEFTDTEGNSTFLSLTATVGKHPSEKAVKKAVRKEPAPKEVIEIED